MKRIISAVLLSALLITSAVSCGSKDAADRTNISSTSSDCEKYAEWLQNRIGDFDGKVLVCDAERTADYGIDLAMFRSEGYVIKNVGDQTVIAAKSDDGFDRAVRYFANNTENCSNVVYGENERIGQLLIAGTDISEYRIVMPQSYPDGSYKDTAESAADILNFYILDACGFDLEITDKPGQHNIQLIIDDGTKYGDEGVGYEVKNGDLIITGGLKRGLIYAAYDFLEVSAEVFMDSREELASCVDSYLAEIVARLNESLETFFLAGTFCGSPYSAVEFLGECGNKVNVVRLVCHEIFHD